MKNINRTYQFFALTMAFLMLTTSVNLAIDLHYCQGQLKSFSLFGKAKSCHEIKATSMINCPHHQKMVRETEGCSMSKKGCCDNRLLQIQFDKDQMNSNSEFVVSQELQQFLVAFVEVFFHNVSVEKTIQNHQFYQPPIVFRDIPVLHQSFLL